MMEALHDYVDTLTQRFFPSKWCKIQSTDDPWIDMETRVKIEKRKAVFRREGRSDEWKLLKSITNKMIANRQKILLQGRR